MEGLATFYSLLLGNAPMFVVAIIGIALSAVLWPAAPKAALLILSACVLEFVITIANAAMYGWYPPHATQNGGFSSVRWLMTGWSVAASLGHAMAFGLLFWGAFTGRLHARAAVR